MGAVFYLTPAYFSVSKIQDKVYVSSESKTWHACYFCSIRRERQLRLQLVFQAIL